MFTPPPSPSPPGNDRFPRTPPTNKTRTGRRILLLVLLLPAALIVSATLRHFLRIPVLEHHPPVPIHKRQGLTLSNPLPPASSAPTSSSPTSSPTTTSPTSTTIPTVPTAPPVLPTPLPQPFDLTLSSNFSTQSCEAFFSDFTQDEDFRKCRAVSFLLNSSSAFLDAQHNLTLFNSILWATCNTPRTADDCAATMDSLLSRLNSACHDDIDDGNQSALQAQLGFQSYTAMRAAACLEDAKSSAYCYMEAVAAPDPADIYYYALPLGTPVPPATKPSCSPCVKSVLAVYAQYVDTPPGSASFPAPAASGNSTVSAAPAAPLPVLSKTYPAAARLAVDRCGGTYASVGVAEPSSAARHAVPWSAVLLALLAFGIF